MKISGRPQRAHEFVWGGGGRGGNGELCVTGLMDAGQLMSSRARLAWAGHVTGGALVSYSVLD